MIIALLLSVVGCSTSKIDPVCYPKNEILHEAETWKGTVSYSNELEQWFINHHVPGTIDSFYSGLVCNLPAEFKEEHLKVVFSGNLKDDNGKIDPSMVIGGQEFFFLELLEIKIDA